MTRGTPRNEIATIDAKDAHFWWDEDRNVLHVVKFGSAADERIYRDMIGGCDTGACESKWRELSEVERLQWIMEMALEFITMGFDPSKVICEFAKIREFAALGGKSYTMCRALTDALEGEANESPERFTERYLR